MRYIFAVLLSLYGAGTSIADEETMADSSAMKQDDAVDLSGGELASLHSDAYHVLARPWYQKVELSGFGAFWFADSGADGTRPEAGFVIKESALFVEAEVWEEMTLFFELQTTALQRDHNSSVRTGEIYVHFRDLLKRWGAGRMGFKIGRVDIPFGEEYLWQDAPDNSLISNSAAYPWLWDEGVVLYGEWAGGRLGWIASIMDGTRSRSKEDNAAKALNAKIHGSPWETLYLSASAMRNGDAAESAILLGGSFLKPVGADDATSSVGESPSDVVDTRLYQIDAQWKPARATRFDLAAGGAFVDDAVEAFDRDLRWFMLQARQGFGGGFYAVARYSAGPTTTKRVIVWAVNSSPVAEGPSAMTRGGCSVRRWGWAGSSMLGAGSSWNSGATVSRSSSLRLLIPRETTGPFMFLNSSPLFRHLCIGWPNTPLGSRS